MKRLLAGHGLSQGTGDEDTIDAIEGAQALLCLTGSWGLSTFQERPVYDDSICAAQANTSGRNSEEPSSAKPGRHVSKAARTSYSTRSYVWRGPHRGALALKKQQQLADAGHQEQQQQHCHSSASDGNSSRRSSASGAAPSDDDEVAQHQQQQIPSSTRQRDKEWAALTTWLRMNLHHPRTAKKLVLFVGQQDSTTGLWSFQLNPGLTWDDVSIETKLRLKTLPFEAEQAFQHKYPDRPHDEWGSKVQKYRPPGSSSTANVCLGEMVTSLSSIYYQHEPASDLPAPYAQQWRQQQQQPLQHHDARQLQHGGQHAVVDSPTVHPAALLPAAVAAPVAEVHAATGNGASGVHSAAVGACDSTDMVTGFPVPHKQSSAACSVACASTMCHHPSAGLSKLQLLPGIAAAAATGDGTDSCNESGTPVAAWSNYVMG